MCLQHLARGFISPEGLLRLRRDGVCVNEFVLEGLAGVRGRGGAVRVGKVAHEPRRPTQLKLIPVSVT